MQYMTIGMHTENGTPKSPTVKFNANRGDAERQYYLFCAAAAISNYETDVAMFMTTDGRVIESKCWHHAQPEPEPEPEAEGDGK